MSDNLAKKGPPDSTRVNVHETWEVDYWCKKFGCTQQQLIDAVKAVGTSADAVGRHLKR